MRITGHEVFCGAGPINLRIVSNNQDRFRLVALRLVLRNFRSARHPPRRLAIIRVAELSFRSFGFDELQGKAALVSLEPEEIRADRLDRRFL